MSYHALGKFRCDGCKVVESDNVDIPSDELQPMPPSRWLRVSTSQWRDGLHVIESRHFCPSCAPLIESYLRGRPDDKATN